MLGLAGSVTAIADLPNSVLENPAAAAMTLSQGGLLYSSQSPQDLALSPSGARPSLSQWTAAAPAYPFGFLAAYHAPWAERFEGSFPASGNSGVLETRTRELEFGVGWVEKHRHRVSLGLSARLVFGDRTVIPAQSQDLTYTSSAWAFSVGLQAQLKNRWLLGAKFRSAAVLPGSPTLSTIDLPGFFTPAIHVPATVSIGGGWIPNRFFRAAAELAFLGPTGADTRALSDSSRRVGQSWSPQPRLGSEYQFADLSEFRASLAVGGYLEMPRGDGLPLRPHVTAGFEFRPWVLVFAAGIDVASQYQNTVISTGVDVGLLFEKLALVPRTPRPPRGGWLPKFNFLSDEGLARPLVKEWKDVKGPDLIEVGKSLPGKIEERVDHVVDSIENAIDNAERARKARSAPGKNRRR